jgi:putative SOS response-associated peptidase YedK
MCGRYRLSRRKEALAEHFGVDLDDLDWEPRYNIAPAQQVPVIRSDDRGPTLRASLMRWGLIPSWATDPNIGARTINARSETAASKPSFREPLRKQRCLIPADGFYEWQRRVKGRQPFCFEVGDGGIFAFAGLWDRWRGPDGHAVETCTILTTTPNALLSDVHGRMPVILAPRHYDRWLDPTMQHVASAVGLLQPFDSKLMKRYPVSARVNLVANDDPECCAPVDLPATATLFD